MAAPIRPAITASKRRGSNFSPNSGIAKTVAISGAVKLIMLAVGTEM